MPETQTQIERLQSAGLVDSDGFLTAAGNFEATLSKYVRLGGIGITLIEA